MKNNITIFLLLILLINVSNSYALVSIKNDFIEVIGHPESGRIIIKTTKGDPELNTDDNQFLLNEYYPPTSWTTIKINEIDYKYGDSPGHFVVPLQEKNDVLLASWKIHDIDVTLSIEFVIGPTTGREDSVKITYYVINRGYRKKKVGIRMMFDTMLGKSDEAPFQIPNLGDVLTETIFAGNKVPDFWYAFDNIRKPSIKAQCTMVYPDMNKPDKVIFASWDKFEKYYWDFPISKNADFKRTSGKPDSAVALYWEPRHVGPGDRIEAETLFGVYGPTIHIGDIFNVSVSAPVSVGSKPFNVLVDVKNIISSRLRDVRVEIKLPEGISLFNNRNMVIKLGNMEAREKKYTIFGIKSDETLAGEVELKIIVSGFLDTLRSTVTIKRKVRIGRYFSDADSGFIIDPSKWLDYTRINRLIKMLNGGITEINMKLNEINSKLTNMETYKGDQIKEDRKNITENKDKVEQIVPLIRRDPKDVIKKTE